MRNIVHSCTTRVIIMSTWSPTMLSKPKGACLLDSIVWWDLKMFCWPPIAFLDVDPDLSANHLKRQRLCSIPCRLEGFFRRFHLLPQDIGTSPVYIAAQENHVEVPWSESFFFLAGVEKSLSASIVYKSTGKVVVKAALCWLLSHSCRWYKIRKGRLMKGSSRYML